jgi:hypothetical protein
VLGLSPDEIAEFSSRLRAREPRPPGVPGNPGPAGDGGTSSGPPTGPTGLPQRTRSSGSQPVHP